MRDDEFVLSAEQKRLLAHFIRQYKTILEQAITSQGQMQARVDSAFQDLHAAAALALGGRTDLRVDFDTFDVTEILQEGGDQ